MGPDSNGILAILLNPSQFTILKIIAGIGGLLGIIKAAIDLWEKWQDKRVLKMVGKELTHEFFDDEIIKTYTDIYIEPYCSQDDPSNTEDLQKIYSKGNHIKLFTLIDEFLAEGSKNRHMYLLGDTGTGKTAAFINILMRNYQKRRSRKNRIVALRLDHKNVDEYIDGMEAKEKKNTILFLDAFDEDPQAIDDIDNRFNKLVNLTESFKRVVISSRTQFFPKSTAIKQETSIPDTAADRVSGFRTFTILYLLPFDNEQVRKFLNKRYRFWEHHLRTKARRIIANAPSLVLRPLLLKYMSSFTDSEKTYHSSTQIYEEIVNRWINRERIRDKVALRKFSEALAFDLYKNRRINNGQIPRVALRPFALRHGIDLDELELSSRSLLNQDGNGNYKFAHLSIMEYLFVRYFFSLPTQDRVALKWTDQMQSFAFEVIKSENNGANTLNLEKADLSFKEWQGSYTFRKKPKTISKRTLRQLIKKYNFCYNTYTLGGTGLVHQYITLSDGSVVLDLNLGLFWQQSGSKQCMRFDETKAFIEQINSNKFAGFDDWRLPTLEETMSLIEEQKSSNDLFIDPIFDKKQYEIWTSDHLSASEVWTVVFLTGVCSHGYTSSDRWWVRAVR
jgi:hypothetical protein